METKKAEVFAVVVTFNGVRWLDRCLGSLARSTVPVRTIVVDNASDDGTVPFIRRYYPDVILVENETNRGFGWANNVGIRVALERGAEFVYLLNQDAWVEPDVVERLLGLMAGRLNYGILSPMQYDGDEVDLDESFRQLLPADFGAGRLEVYPVEFVMAAHWLVRTEALRETGGFLPLFRHYGEDKNLIHRMNFHGWKAGIAPGPRAFHDRKDRPESGEQRLHICYGRYLSQLADISRRGKRFWPKHFKELLAAVVRADAPVKIRLGYALKAVGRMVPVVYYRYCSRRTKKTDFRWIY